jgi:peptidoglycan/xylan/chitin deacetylase (PgdA/CDA1 family)
MLDVLANYSAKATFFITGINNAKGAIDTTAAWVTVIQKMYAAGHQLASHTWSHPDLSTLSEYRRRDEMYKLEMAMRNIVGFFPTYMRPPYSSCNSDCLATMDALGYHVTYDPIPFERPFSNILPATSTSTRTTTTTTTRQRSKTPKTTSTTQLTLATPQLTHFSPLPMTFTSKPPTT